MRFASRALALLLTLGLPATARAQTLTPATPATQFDFASGLYDRGHYASAADAFTAFLDLAPNDPNAERAMFLLGESRFALKEYPPAQQAYQTVLHRWPAGTKADASRLRLGQCALERGQYPEAITQLEGLVGGDLTPEVRAATLYALGQAAYEHDAADTAIGAFTKLAALPSHLALVPYADYYLGYLRWHGGDATAAHRHFAAFGAASTDAALRGEALVRAGETALATGQTDAARTAFQQALGGTLTPGLRDSAVRGQAWAQYEAGQFAEVMRIQETSGADVTDPATRAEVRYVAGEAAFQAKDYARAQQELTAVVADAAADAVRSPARLRLAWTLFLLEDYAACATLADASLATGTAAGREELAYLAAAARFGTGDHARAAQGLRAFVSAFPASSLRGDAYYQLGVSEQTLGRLTQALEAFDAAVQAGDAATRGARSLFKAGEVRFALEDFDGAAQQWNLLVHEHAEDPLAGDAFFRLGLARYRQDRVPEMEAAFADMRARFPDHPLRVDAAYWQGWAQQRQEQFAEAAASFAVVTRERDATYYADALARQALCAYQADQESQAAVLYVRYLREIPDRPLPRDVLFWLGHFMRERGEWETAKFVYERAMVQHPTDDVMEAARYEIGRCYVAGTHLSDALAAFDRVLADYPDGAYGAKAHLGRGTVLQAQRRYQDALAALTQAAQGDEGMAAAEANLRMGQCFEAQQLWQDAADRYLFVTIVFDAPTLAGEAYMGAGRSLEKLADRARAVATYAEFAERYPEDPLVVEAQARVEALTPAPAPVPPAAPPAAS